MTTQPPLDQQGLRCPVCAGALVLEPGAGSLECAPCGDSYPVKDGVPRLLERSLREAVMLDERSDRANVATARSFGYEWTRFPEMYAEWEQNFLDYMAPHGRDFFAGKRVLDAGCGNGRHAHYAAAFGAQVFAVDIGPACDVARRNTREVPGVQVVQADLNALPFEPESFDFIYSIGVLHHLQQPEAAFANLLRYVKPGGQIQIYHYWKPEGQPVKRALLGLVTLLRMLTTRLPFGVVYALSYPAALLAFLTFVWPYMLLRGVPGVGRLVERFPMKQYARYPFRVCVNDQFDRFSAPIENRYTRAEVEGWLTRCNLEGIQVISNFGWVGTGRKPKPDATASSTAYVKA